jgi:hypothetical protein
VEPPGTRRKTSVFRRPINQRINQFFTALCLSGAIVKKPLFDIASCFYKSPKVELPGYVILSIGLIDVLGWRMISQPTDFDIITGQAFLDDDFAADVRMPIDRFLDSPSKASEPLFSDLKFGFDL